MPSGKTHDAITFALAPFAGFSCYLITREAPISAVAAVAFLFGGLMFGPDLDTNSKQFARWWIFKPIWLPYRLFFAHRSRWTHGLLFGSLFRVIYFMGLLTLGSFAAVLFISAYSGADTPSATAFTHEWKHFGEAAGQRFGMSTLAAAFIGLWAGAASHTFTDIAGSYIKTGRIGKAL